MNNTMTVGTALIVCAVFMSGFIAGAYAERIERRARARQFAREQREGMSPFRDYHPPRVSGTKRHH